MKFVAIFTVLALAVATPAPGWSAPQAAIAPQPTAKALALSQRYIKAVDMPKQLDTVPAILLPQLLAAQGASLKPEEADVLSQVTREAMTAFYPKILAEAANEFATIYTEDELQVLVDFYEAPLGKSITEKAPRAAPAMAAAMKKMVPELQADMLQRLCAKIDCSTKTPANKKAA
jgi:hypothetical protein